MKALLEKIDSKEAVVGVVGLGYVGLPLAIAFAECGFRVLGFDSDSTKARKLQRGESYLSHVSPEEFRPHVESGRLAFAASYDALVCCDAYLVCVPTPLGPNREPDLTCVQMAATGLWSCAQPGKLFVLESSTYPGTTRDVFAPLLTAETKLEVGRDIFVAHSPERQDPGNQRFKTRNVPRVVGGLTRNCLCVASRLYRKVIETVVDVEDAETAEMVKLFENTYRLVNISLVNELKVLCHRMGVDAWSVVKAAATKPFGFQSFKPGPGIGGHCIPIDPFYLTWKAHAMGLPTRFIELAGEVNEGMPHYVIERVMLGLNSQGKPFKGARVLVLGVAYKANVNDVRESPALKVIAYLQLLGAQVSYHDPRIPEIELLMKEQVLMDSVPLTSERVQESDAIVVLTDHDDVDYGKVAELAKLVVDTRCVEALRSMGTGRYFQA